MTMQWARNLILVGLAIVSYLMILAWQKDYGTSPQPTAETAVNRSVEASASMNLPASPTAANSDVPVAPVSTDLVATAPTTPTQSFISVKTDVLDVKIDTLGGDVVALSLPTLPKRLIAKRHLVY